MSYIQQTPPQVTTATKAASAILTKQEILDGSVRIEGGIAAVTLTLPPLEADLDGISCDIKRAEDKAEDCTLAADAADTIDGAASVPIATAGDSIRVTGRLASNKWDIK